MPASGSEPEPPSRAIARFVFAIGDAEASLETFDALAVALYPNESPEDRVYRFAEHHDRYSPASIDGEVRPYFTSTVLLWLARALLDADRRRECMVAVNEIHRRSLVEHLRPSEADELNQIERALGLDQDERSFSNARVHTGTSRITVDVPEPRAVHGPRAGVDVAIREETQAPEKPTRRGRRRPQISIDEARAKLGDPDMKPNSALLGPFLVRDEYSILLVQPDAGQSQRHRLVPRKIHGLLTLFFRRCRGRKVVSVDVSEAIQELGYAGPSRHGALKRLQNRANKILGELGIGKISNTSGMLTLDPHVTLTVHGR